jgi:ketosteroid isomerase-like protein
MVRSTQEVFDHHRSAFEPPNLEKLMADYADDAILLTLDGEFVGKQAIRGFFQNAFESLPNFKVSFDKTAVAGDTFLLEWSGEADNAIIPHGVATFNIRDGMIQRQTEWMVMAPKEG